MGAGGTPIISQGCGEDRSQCGGIIAVGSGRDVTGTKEDYTAAAQRLHGGQPAMAKQVEVVGGDDATAELVDLGALWRGVAREEGAGEDNIAPEVAGSATAIHTAALRGSCIARDGAVDKEHLAKAVYCAAASAGGVARDGAVGQGHGALVVVHATAEARGRIA